MTRPKFDLGDEPTRKSKKKNNKQPAQRAVKYQVVKGGSASVGETVEKMLKKGWQLYGSPMLDTTGSCAFVFQAMVKY